MHTGVGIRPAAPAGAALPPYTPPNAPRERPLPLPLGEVAERSEGGEGKRKRTAFGRFFSLSINLSCHSKEHPKGTCFAAQSDVGIRNLLTANLHENA